MATFNNLGLQEPSTITARVATVQIARGSTNEQQEIMCLGDPNSSGAIAECSSANPTTSTQVGLIVKPAGGFISSLGGIVTIQGNSTVAPLAGSTWNVRALQSSAADLQVTATQGTNPWTIAGNSTVFQGSSAWQVQVTNHAQSTTAPASNDTGLVVRQVGYVAPSTTIQVSSVAGRVQTAPSDTNWASSAGFHFTSSGELQVNASFSGSTIVTVSTVQGVVTTQPASTGSTLWYPVRLTDGSTWIPPGTEYTEASTAGTSTITGVAIMWRDSSGAMHPVDPTRALPVSGSFSASTTVNVSSVSGRVATAPNDTSWASSAGFHFDSSGALLTVASFTGSTTVNVSSVAGTVLVAPASSAATLFFPVRLSDGSTLLNPAVDYTHDAALTFSTVTGPVCLAHASSATPSAVSADNDAVALWASLQGALNMILRDSTGGLVAVGTSQPSSNANALVVRPVIQPGQTIAASTWFQTATAYTLVSSAAASVARVYAYSITSTETTARNVGFYSGSTLLWTVTLQAPSSGISGANSPGCAPPASLFANSTGQPLTVNISGSSGPLVAISVAYFTST